MAHLLHEASDIPGGPHAHHEGNERAMDAGNSTDAPGNSPELRFERDESACARLRDAVFEHAEHGLVITDRHWRILDANPAFARMVGAERGGLASRDLRCFRHDRHRATFFDRIETTLETTGRWTGEMWMVGNDGRLFPAIVTFSAVQEGGSVHYLTGDFADITHRKGLEQDLALARTYDRLTDLPNRRTFHEHLEDVITRAMSHDEAVAVLYLGIDDFHLVNEAFGYAAGDQALRAVGRRLRDQVLSPGLVARLGGDEFVVLLHTVRRRADAAAVAQKIARAMASPITLPEQDIYLSTRLGIGLWPDDALHAEALVRAAATAMNRAKDTGQPWVFYSGDLEAERRHRMRLGADLHHAVERNELILHYQPIVEAKNQRVVACEALLRWQHPKEGHISPARFIPLAEATGLIREIGHWVIEEAAAQSARWSAKHREPIRIAVNLSAQQLADPELPSLVAKIFERHGADPTCFEFEITESLMVERVDEAERHLAALKALGCSIAIDDFGTGYSSLSYLKSFPADVVKIDRTFVQDIDRDTRGDVIAGAVIALAHGLGLEVVAEGIETEAQNELLTRQGADRLQGYLFGRPRPAAALRF